MLIIFSNFLQLDHNISFLDIEGNAIGPIGLNYLMEACLETMCITQLVGYSVINVFCMFCKSYIVFTQSIFTVNIFLFSEFVE